MTQPVTGWGVRPVAGLMVLLQIEYVQNPEQLESGQRLQLQGLIRADLALEMAEALKRAADALVGGAPPGVLIQ
jgi:hypothetical protein